MDVEITAVERRRLAFVQIVCELPRKGQRVPDDVDTRPNVVFQVDLYVDNRLISPTASDSEIVEDFALTSIDGTDGTVFTVGACWHGKYVREVQIAYSGLSRLGARCTSSRKSIAL